MKQTLILPINRAVVTASMGNAAYQARFGFPHYGTDLVSAVGDPPSTPAALGPWLPPAGTAMPATR